MSDPYRIRGINGRERRPEPLMMSDGYGQHQTLLGQDGIEYGDAFERAHRGTVRASITLSRDPVESGSVIPAFDAPQRGPGPLERDRSDGKPVRQRWVSPASIAIKFGPSEGHGSSKDKGRKGTANGSQGYRKRGAPSARGGRSGCRTSASACEFI
jgi:hypothetical protein